MTLGAKNVEHNLVGCSTMLLCRSYVSLKLLGSTYTAQQHHTIRVTSTFTSSGTPECLLENRNDRFEGVYFFQALPALQPVRNAAIYMGFKKHRTTLWDVISSLPVTNAVLLGLAAPAFCRHSWYRRGVVLLGMEKGIAG